MHLSALNVVIRALLEALQLHAPHHVLLCIAIQKRSIRGSASGKHVRDTKSSLTENELEPAEIQLVFLVVVAQ